MVMGTLLGAQLILIDRLVSSPPVSSSRLSSSPCSAKLIFPVTSYGQVIHAHKASVASNGYGMKSRLSLASEPPAQLCPY